MWSVVCGCRLQCLGQVSLSAANGSGQEHRDNYINNDQARYSSEGGFITSGNRSPIHNTISPVLSAVVSVSVAVPAVVVSVVVVVVTVPVMAVPVVVVPVPVVAVPAVPVAAVVVVPAVVVIAGIRISPLAGQASLVQSPCH